MTGVTDAGSAPLAVTPVPPWHYIASCSLPRLPCPIVEQDQAKAQLATAQQEAIGLTKRLEELEAKAPVTGSVPVPDASHQTGAHTSQDQRQGPVTCSHPSADDYDLGADAHALEQVG